MKKIIFILLALIFVSSTSGQSISVSSFKLLESDLTANTAGTMEKDQNGETAALIKVVTTQTGFSFDCGSMGIVKTVQKPSEIWVYVPHGVKKMTISHPKLGILRDYFFPIVIEPARTYEMVLISGTVETVVKQSRTSQYVVFQLKPENAIVEIDGELLETYNGTATKMLKFGTYNYRVKAPNYLSEAGKVIVDDPDEKVIVDISLKPNFSSVTVTVDDNSEIWVNGIKRGVGIWHGELGAGTYEFEAKKENHRSTILTQDIVVSKEPLEIRLKTPMPILGEANINSSPAMADIYIDDMRIGETPMLVSKLLVGNHSISIRKSGYIDNNSTITIDEKKVTEYSIKLLKTPDDYGKLSKIQNPKKFHDAEAQEAYGKVKSITVSVMGQSQTSTFDESGKLLSGPMSDIVYDADGYAKSAKLEMMGQKLAVEYKWEKGKVVGTTVEAMGQKITSTRTFNDKGATDKESINMGGQTTETPYTDYKYDDKGNWISRKSSMMGQTMEQTRTIVYY